MKKFVSILIVLTLILSAGLFAEPVGTVVDSSMVDNQFYYGYTDNLTKRIYVDDAGDVHMVYRDNYTTTTDTTFRLKYANVTKGEIHELPDNGVSAVAIDGATGSDVFLYAARDYWHINIRGTWGKYGKIMKVTDSGVDSIGTDTQKGYYADAGWAWAQDIEVVSNETVWFMHSLWDAVSWCIASFDGTNNQFGEKFNMGWTYADQNVPGCKVYNKGAFYPNLTLSGDLAVNSDGTELSMAVLSPFNNIYVFKGTMSGLSWPDSLYLGQLKDHDESHIDWVYDTTGFSELPTISDDLPKPQGYVSAEYDNNDDLHLVYNATYSNHVIDTAMDAAGYGGSYGDSLGTYYDGTEHPKPQILHWDEVNRNVTTIAKAEYPQSGTTYQWFNWGTIDSGYAEYAKYAKFGIIEHPQLIVNRTAEGDEPDMAVAWVEMQGGTVQEGLWRVSKSTDSTGAVVYDTSGNYVAYYRDIKMSSYDGSWSAPVNVTNTEDWDESELSVHRDIIDGKLHMTYNSDPLPGSDNKLAYVESYADYYTGGGWFDGGYPMQKSNSVLIMHHVTDAVTSVDNNNRIVGQFELSQNYPNPFNPTTVINYKVPRGKVKLDIYNILGQKVRTLVDKSAVTPGKYKVKWNGRNDYGEIVSSGIYIYKLRSEMGVKAKKMVFQK